MKHVHYTCPKTISYILIECTKNVIPVRHVQRASPSIRPSGHIWPREGKAKGEAIPKERVKSRARIAKIRQRCRTHTRE